MIHVGDPHAYVWVLYKKKKIHLCCLYPCLMILSYKPCITFHIWLQVCHHIT